MNSECLLVKGLNENFGGLQALTDVNLSLQPGERRAIIGPNGAGKTTLFNLIGGTLRPYSGEIHMFGRDVTRLLPHHRTALGLGRTFQITNLFPNLSLFENVLLAVQASETAWFSSLRKVSAHRQWERKAYDLLEKWGLITKAQERVSNLSYGDQRQVDLILALAGKPKLLLLDEPTAGLSPAETAVVTEVIRGLDDEMTILLIEHDIDVAFGLVDRVSVLHMGSILAEGSPDEIKEEPRVQEVYLGKD